MKLTYIFESRLCLLRTNTASLDLAMFALEDVPESASVTVVAMPQEQSCVGFDHDEGVVAGAITRNGHGE